MITFLTFYDFLFYYLTIAAIVACIAAFVLTLVYKWGGVEYMQVHGNDFFSKLANCSFCLSWWCCCLVALTAFLATGETALLLTPFCATKLTQKLL